jgi:hypothetical protein
LDQGNEDYTHCARAQGLTSRRTRSCRSSSRKKRLGGENHEPWGLLRRGMGKANETNLEGLK